MAHETAVVSASVLATMLRLSSRSDSVNFSTALEDCAVLRLKSVEALRHVGPPLLDLPGRRQILIGGDLLFVVCSNGSGHLRGSVKELLD